MEAFDCFERKKVVVAYWGITGKMLVIIVCTSMTSDYKASWGLKGTMWMAA
jgi:hypothetical protein